MYHDNKTADPQCFVVCYLKPWYIKQWRFFVNCARAFLPCYLLCSLFLQFVFNKNMPPWHQLQMILGISSSRYILYAPMLTSNRHSSSSESYRSIILLNDVFPYGGQCGPLAIVLSPHSASLVGFALTDWKNEVTSFQRSKIFFYQWLEGQECQCYQNALYSI